MSNTFTQIYIQAVWAVKYRNAVLDKKWRQELFAVVGNLINQSGCKTYIVNGVEDHIHCFFSLKPSVSLSDVMRVAKGRSSKWLNDTNYLDNRFEWQRGFGGFSYSKSSVNNVYNYIKNQENHHRKQKFLDEYIETLQKFNIDFDENYIFKEMI